MLEAVAHLFNLKGISGIIDDEWFWLEWNDSIECFYYVYGLSTGWMAYSPHFDPNTDLVK